MACSCRNRTLGRGRLGKSGGFTLTELTVVLAVIATLLVVRMDYQRRQHARDLHKQVGNNVAQVVQGLRAYLSENSGAGAATHADLDFLRDASCPSASGTASKAYLPCRFPDNLGLDGITYDITINSGGPSGLTATLQLDPVSMDGRMRSDLAGVIAQQANGFNFKIFSPTGAATFYQIESDPETAVVTATTSTTPSADAWLRTDGSNDMEADLAFDGPDRDIVNADVVEATSLEDADDPTYYVDPASQSNLDEVVANRVEAPRYYDSDDTSYYVDPDSTSEMDQIEVSEIIDRDDNAYGLDPDGTSDLQTLNAETIRLGSKNDMSLEDLLPKFVHKATYRARHGTYVPKPDCPGYGFPRIIVTANVVVTSGGASAFYASNHSGYWRTRMRRYRSNGGSTGDSRNYGLAQTYCYYG